MPALWAAGIAAVGGIAGAAISSSAQADAAQTAADSQYASAQLATQTQKDIYNQTRSDLAPYLNTGTSALQQLSSMFGLGGSGPTSATAGKTLSALQNYPGYQFQLQQGQQALDRSAASKGLLLSGGQIKDSQAFGQGLAQSSALAPYLAQLNTMGSLGENAGAITGNAGSNASGGIASSILAGGQAQAGGAVGSANALTAGIQGGLNSALAGYQLLNQPGDYSFSPTNYSGLTYQNFDSVNSNAFTPLAGY